MINLQEIKPGDLVYNEVLNETKLIVSIEYLYQNRPGENVYHIVWIDHESDIISFNFNDIYAYRFSKVSE